MATLVQHVSKILSIATLLFVLLGVLFTVDNLDTQIDITQKGNNQMAGAANFTIGAGTGGQYIDPVTGKRTTSQTTNGGRAMTGGYMNYYSPNITSPDSLQPIEQIGGDSGYSSGGTDPYAQYGGQAAYNTLKSGYDAQKANIYGSSNDAAESLRGGLNQSVLDTIHALTVGQQGIDRKNVQNEASKIQGGRDVMSMVGQGIKSGGVMLANKNAGSSSAAQGIANAWGQKGQQQLSSIGNQYASNQGDIAVSQDEQNYQQAQAPGKFHEGLMGNVNNIVNSARDKFAQLDAAMANASLPDRIAIEQEKESVRQQVLGRLQQYDAQLAQGVGGIKATSQEDNRTKANSQLAAGQADPNLFNYSTETPSQFQNTGPFASELPIFTYKNKRQVA